MADERPEAVVALRKLRVWSELVTHRWAGGTYTRRVWHVDGPLGPSGPSHRGLSSHEAAIAQADREARHPSWAIMAGTHECSLAELGRTRPVAGEGVYCGHGRFLAVGERILVDGRLLRLGMHARMGA